MTNLARVTWEWLHIVTLQIITLLLDNINRIKHGLIFQDWYIDANFTLQIFDLAVNHGFDVSKILNSL